MTRALSHLLRDDIGGTPFCPGCGHGILMGALLRAVENLRIPHNDLLFVSGIGCAGWIPSPHFKADTLHTLHGRAIPFATGAKLAKPGLTVIVVSGDGDLTSIGGNHLVHGARRNVDITVIMANNGIYGMTGGQTAATTPVDVRTATHPDGNPEPSLDACRLVMASGARYAARFPVSQPAILTTAIERAISTPGFAFVEALSPCPTQVGHRNQCFAPADLYRALDARCAAAGELSDTRDHIVTGEFLP